jgi:glutamate dehydrogenase
MGTLFGNVKKQIDEVILLIEDEYFDKKSFHSAVKLLKKPQKLHSKKITIHMDNGRRKSYLAFRSQHNDARGPFKGGIRFHPQVSEDEVKALSTWMSIKCSLINIPYGGGKGGIKVDPKALSEREIERLCKKYSEFLTPYIGPWRDIPAPDVNTGEKEMAYMLEAFERKKGMHAPGTFTGKPIALGGSLGRTEATGLGAYYILEDFAKVKKLQKKKTTVAVQGFGNVGYWFAKFAKEAGFLVVAVSDSTSGLADSKGLDIDKLYEWKSAGNYFGNYKEGETLKKISNEVLLTLNVDILAPAALEAVINDKNSSKIQAKTIMELANGPTTPEAEDKLIRKGKDVLPDVLCNAGGVVVSYFEWVQNLRGSQWEKKEVYKDLKHYMNTGFQSVYELVKAKKTSYRKAAYALAVKRIIDAMILRGRV